MHAPSLSASSSKVQALYLAEPEAGQAGIPCSSAGGAHHICCLHAPGFSHAVFAQCWSCSPQDGQPGSELHTVYAGHLQIRHRHHKAHTCRTSRSVARCRLRSFLSSLALSSPASARRASSAVNSAGAAACTCGEAFTLLLAEPSVDQEVKKQLMPIQTVPLLHRCRTAQCTQQCKHWSHRFMLYLVVKHEVGEGGGHVLA